MNDLNVFLLVFSILTFVIVLFIILFKYFNDKIKDIDIKIEDAKKCACEKLQEKYNIIIKTIELIENKYKIESKKFEEVREMKNNSFSSFKNDKVLDKCYEEIIKIKDDKVKGKEFKPFKNILRDYDENELHIISIRTYYNKYTLIYNSMLKKFPYNTIAKFKKYKLKLLFEGKELDDCINI